MSESAQELAHRLLRISLYHGLAIQWAKHVVESTVDDQDKKNKYKEALEYLEKNRQGRE